MKKILIFTLCLSVLLTICACGKKKSKKVDNSKQNESSSSIVDSSSQDDSSTAVTTSPSASTTSAKLKPTPDIPYSALKSDSSQPNKQETDKVVIDYLNAIKNKDFNIIKKYMKVSDDKVYSLINSINFYDLSISSIERPTTSYLYKVTFSTDCKDSNLFINGKNSYIIWAYGDSIFSFLSLESPNTIMDSTEYSYYKDMCLCSELVKTELPNLTEDAYVKKPEFDSPFFDFIAGNALCVYQMSTGAPYNFTKEVDFSKFAAQNPYLQGINIKRSRFYNKSSGTLYGWMHYRIFYNNIVSSVRRLDSNNVEFIIDYYCDSTSLIKSKTIKYVLTGKPYKNLKISSATVLFDNKLPLMNNR